MHPPAPPAESRVPVNLQQIEQEVLADVETFEAGQTVSVQIDSFSYGPIKADLASGAVDVTLWGWIPFNVPLSSFRVVLPALGPALITAAPNALQIVKTT